MAYRYKTKKYWEKKRSNSIDIGLRSAPAPSVRNFFLKICYLYRRTRLELLTAHEKKLLRTTNTAVETTVTPGILRILYSYRLQRQHRPSHKKPETRLWPNMLVPTEGKGGRFPTISYTWRAPRLHTLFSL